MRTGVTGVTGVNRAATSVRARDDLSLDIAQTVGSLKEFTKASVDSFAEAHAQQVAPQKASLGGLKTGKTFAHSEIITGEKAGDIAVSSPQMSTLQKLAAAVGFGGNGKVALAESNNGTPKAPAGLPAKARPEQRQV